VCCSVVQFGVVCHSVVQCVAVCRSVLQCVVSMSRVLRRVPPDLCVFLRGSKRDAVFGSVCVHACMSKNRVWVRARVLIVCMCVCARVCERGGGGKKGEWESGREGGMKILEREKERERETWSHGNTLQQQRQRL